MSFFSKIKQTISLKNLFSDKKINPDSDQLEEILLESDMSYDVVSDILKHVNSKYSTLSYDELKGKISDYISSTLEKSQKQITFASQNSPFVAIFCGVNGSGKTTTIGKLASKLAIDGKKVMIAACDTFRAAASEQIKIWADHSKCHVVSQNVEFEDPSAVAYRAMELAISEQYDVLLIDTSGRLQTNKNLMLELQKIYKTVQKFNPHYPSETIMILDATIGQNNIHQVNEFLKYIPISSIIITKLDSSAKCGAIVTIAKMFHKIGISMIGVGEKSDNLQDFNAREFAQSLIE